MPQVFPQGCENHQMVCQKELWGQKNFEMLQTVSPSWKVIVVLDNIKAFEKPYMKETGLILLNPVFAWIYLTM